MGQITSIRTIASNVAIVNDILASPPSCLHAHFLNTAEGKSSHQARNEACLESSRHVLAYAAFGAGGTSVSAQNGAARSISREGLGKPPLLDSTISYTPSCFSQVPMFPFYRGLATTPLKTVICVALPLDTAQFYHHIPRFDMSSLRDGRRVYL